MRHIEKTILIFDFVKFKKELIAAKLAKNGKLNALLLNYNSKLVDARTLKVSFDCTKQVEQIFNDIIR